MMTTDTKRPVANRATIAVLTVLILSTVAGAAWYYRPSNADHRYSQMSLVNLRQLLDREPDNAKAWRQMALRLARAGDAAMAEPALKRAFELNPRDAVIATGIGELLTAENRFSEAQQALLTATAVKPGDATAHRDLGVLYYKTERLQQAADEFRIVTTLDKSADDAWYQIGMSDMAMHRIAEAQDATAHALAIAPNNASYLALMGRIDVESGRADQGIDETKRAAEAAPRDVRIQSEYVNLLLEHHRNTNDLDVAEQRIGTLEQLAPDFPPIPFQRGKLEMLRNNWQTAARYLNIALRASPQQDDVATALSQTYTRLNRPDDARQLTLMVNHRKELRGETEAVRAAIRATPGDVNLYIKLANLQMQLGNQSAAHAAMNSGLQIDPQNSILLKWQHMLEQKPD